MIMDSAEVHQTTVQNGPNQMASTTKLEAISAPFTVPDKPPELATAPKPMESNVSQQSRFKNRPHRSKPASAHSRSTNATNLSPSKSSDSTPSSVQQGTNPEEAENKTSEKHNSKVNNNNNKKTNQRPDLTTADLEVRVEVSGYPTYTKAHDLHAVFAPLGSPCIEHIGRKVAVVKFETTEAVAAALRNNMQLCLYGEFLTIKPFSGTYDDRKKQVFKSKHAVVTVEPSRIPLVGSFGTQLGALLAAVRLTQAEVGALASLYGDLERAMHACWPGCQAMPFGSITTGLGVKSSDADCFMNVPPQFRFGSFNFVNKAKRILQQYPEIFTEVFAIPRANTPIVKLFHLPTKTHCDLTFKTPLGALNSKLIAFLLHADPRFLPLAVVVKYWASVHGLSGSGKLTNYALTLLVIFFLQSRSLLPSVAWLQKDAEPAVVDGWNTAFVAEYDRLPRPPNATSIEELLGEFFKFYDTFDFENRIVCPLLGRPIDKVHFAEKTLPSEFERYEQNVADYLVAPLRTRAPMCVQDPFEQCHNVASSVTLRLYKDIHAYFHFAAEFYERDKANGCTELLPTILLKKPKLPRGKCNNIFRTSFQRKVLQSIISDDWPATFRKTVFFVLEDMLKLKLEPDGEMEVNASGRKKEKFLISLEKPVWKKRKFVRLYDVVKTGFVGRQTRLTEEILRSEQSDLSIKVRFTFSCSTNKHRSWVGVKFIDGNLEAFQAFGKFFVANMQLWLIGVLRANGDTSLKGDCTELEACSSEYESDSFGDDSAAKEKDSKSEDALNDAMQASDLEAEAAAEIDHSMSDEGLKESGDTSASDFD